MKLTGALTMQLVVLKQVFCARTGDPKAMKIQPPWNPVTAQGMGGPKVWGRSSVGFRDETLGSIASLNRN